MNYGQWRHENAMGNSAAQNFALCRLLHENKDPEPIIYVEHEFQKHFAMCIPGITEDRIKYFTKEMKVEYNGSVEPKDNWGGYNNHLIEHIKMPLYGFLNRYDADWSDLRTNDDVCFKFPYDVYENKHNLPDNAIVITIREAGTFWKRIDGANSEPSRFVNPEIFFRIALHYADQGYKIIRLGDKNQTPMPKHDNITDFALYEDRNMLDDLYVISKCKVHLSCDSGIWPMTGGFKKNLVLSNVTSAFGKMSIVDWLHKHKSIVLFKQNGQDNTFGQLKESVDRFL